MLLLLILPKISWNCHFEFIESLQCYELTRRCSHLPLHAGYTIDLCCIPLVCTFDFFTYRQSWQFRSEYVSKCDIRCQLVKGIIGLFNFEWHNQNEVGNSGESRISLGGAPTPQSGCANLLFCRKMLEKWKNVDPQGVRVPGAPLRSATG